MKRSKLNLDQLNRLTPEEYTKSKKLPIVVVADNIRSAMNIGSMFRTCDAFAVERLLLTGISAKPPHREITKTAIGATETVEWEYISRPVEVLQQYKDEGYRLISIEQTNDSTPLKEYLIEKSQKIILVFGNEVSGVSNEIIELSDDCIEIVQFGTKHSLNVSVCAGIVLWAFNTNPLK